MLRSLSTKRIYSDYKLCQDFDGLDINIKINEQDVFIWNILIIPKDGFYKNIPLNFTLKFDTDYVFTNKLPEIIMPYLIKHSEYIQEFGVYKFTICYLHNYDLINPRSLLIQLYWYFNIFYVEYKEKQTHIFYDKGIYDSVEVDNCQDTKDILTDLIYDIIEYNTNYNYFTDKMSGHLENLFKIKENLDSYSKQPVSVIEILGGNADHKVPNADHKVPKADHKVPKSNTPMATNVKSDSISKLPVEILDKIFGYLDTETHYKLRLTSKYFKDVINSPVYWEKTKLQCSYLKEHSKSIGLLVYVCSRSNITPCDITVRNSKIDYESELIIRKEPISYDCFRMYKEIMKNLEAYANISEEYFNLGMCGLSREDIILPLIINERNSHNVKTNIETSLMNIYNYNYNKETTLIKSTCFNCKIVPSVFTSLFMGIMLDTMDQHDYIKYFDTISQLQYMLVKLIDWYPKIEANLNASAVFFLSYIHNSLKDYDIFRIILGIGLSTVHKFTDIKYTLAKEVFKKIFRSIEPFIEINKIKNINEEITRRTLFIRQILKFTAITENLVSFNGNIKKTKDKLSYYYGFPLREHKMKLYNKLIRIDTMKLSYRNIYCELNNSKKWISSREIHSKLQDYYYCALKNRYITQN